MKKAVLFLGLLGGLVSCNSAPECGDKEVSKLVREIIIDNYNIVGWWNVTKEYYAEDYEKYKKELEELKQSIGYNKDQEYIFEWNIKTEYNNKRNKIQDDYRGEEYYEKDSVYSVNSKGLKKMEELEEEENLMMGRLKEIENRYKWKEKVDFVKIAYKREDKIQEIINRLYPVGISNIRNISSDKENKKCDCEGTLKWGDNKSKEIYFTAQRNTDGDLYVEVMQ